MCWLSCLLHPPSSARGWWVFSPRGLRLNYLDAAEGSAACTVQPFVCPWALFCFRAVHVSRRAEESWVEWKQEYCLSCSWDFYVEVHWKHALWHWTSLWAWITALRKRMSLLSGVGNSMALLPDKLLWIISKGQYPCLTPEESSGVFLCWTGGMWACECVAWWSFSTRLHVNTEYQQWSWHTAFLLKLAFYTFFMCVCQLADGMQRLREIEPMAATKADISHFQALPSGRCHGAQSLVLLTAPEADWGVWVGHWAVSQSRQGKASLLRDSEGRLSLGRSAGSQGRWWGRLGLGGSNDWVVMFMSSSLSRAKVTALVPLWIST